MKDGFDAVKDIRSLIAIPAIEAPFNVKIWPQFMPSGLQGSNIVVKALFIKHKVIQSGILLVTLHVPNITVQNQAYPDIISFSALERSLIPLLHERYELSFWCEVDEILPVQRDYDGSHYQTIRVHYYSYNSEYTNI